MQLGFNESQIVFSQVEDHEADFYKLELTDYMKGLWEKCKQGKSIASVHPRGSCFNHTKLKKTAVAPTVASSNAHSQYHYDVPRRISNNEIVRMQTFPQDYNFITQDVGYVCGMSVPPFMMQRLSLEIGKQLFNA